MILLTPQKRAIFFLLTDSFISLFTLYLAYNLRFNFEIDQTFLDKFLFIFTVLLALKISMISYFKLYHISWRFVSLYDVKRLLYAHIISYTLFIMIFLIFPDFFIPFSRSVLLMDLFFSMLFIGTFRISKRLIIESIGNSVNSKKTLLIGVSPFAQTIIKDKNNFYISAIIDNDEMVVGSYVSNIKIQEFKFLETIVKREKIRTVIIAKSYDKESLKSIYKILNTLNIYDIRVVILEKKKEKLKKITVEDLLARNPKDLDLEAISSFIKDKNILITGAGGSIGSEIARQCYNFKASSLTLIDHSEYNLYQIGQEIENANLKLISITDNKRLTKIFKEINPQIVIHTAAYKHVPLCESNQEIAIFNNIQGTKNIIDLSIKYQVAKVVIISTDKAVRPTNVMGATKRVTELYANNVDSKNTEIVAVRFGNVLGSSGSVIPKFKSQIEAGEDITVTHPDITRYFMLIPEACQLVLQTATIAKGGELFILDMGDPIKIVDLAKKMIKLYGKENEVKIKFIGLRKGEKLYEELLLDDSEQKTKYRSIFIAKPTYYNIDNLNSDIEELFKAENRVLALQKIVPEFTRNNGIVHNP